MLTDKQKAKIGTAWASELLMRPSPTHPNDRYDLATGDKSPLGVFNTISRMVQEAHHIPVPPNQFLVTFEDSTDADDFIQHMNKMDDDGRLCDTYSIQRTS